MMSLGWKGRALMELAQVHGDHFSVTTATVSESNTLKLILAMVCLKLFSVAMQ